MKHYGDICRMVGAEIEPVDCIIGGSPCQDLSIAGKRAGLAGARSGLFMEQIRIIREMREHDRKNGRTGEFIRPRYMVWENVCGAMSSNKGRDFAAVLEEAIRIAEPEAPDIPVPEKGWPTYGGYRDMDGRWSVAWRVLDAQHWGVPQRRRRIALVADFGGTTAHEILFNRKGVYGHPAAGGETGERPAECTERGAYKSGEGVGQKSVFCLQGNGIDRADTAGCNGKGWREDVSYTLNTIDRPAVCAGFKLGNSEQARSIGCQEEQSPTLNAECGGNKPAVVCFNGETVTSKTNASNPHAGDPCHTLGATGAGRSLVIENQTKAFSFDSLASNSMKSSNPHSGCREVDTARTLDTTSPDPSKNQGGIAILDMSHANDVIRECGDVVPTLQSRMGTGGNQVPLTLDGKETVSTLQARDYKGVGRCDTYGRVISTPIVRRLTPMEYERLQGFPDKWTDIGAWTDEKGKVHKESSDSARYKALGNSIALPPWKWVLKRLCAQYERDATMGSLFDGIGGFPLLWIQLNGWNSVKWASEIEPFCIAVTKRHFGDENSPGDAWKYFMEELLR